MDQHIVPSAPLGDSVDAISVPPSYDEAMANMASGPKNQNILNPAQVTETYQGENELKKKEQKMEAPPPANAPPPVVTSQPQPQTTYSFQQPVNQQPQPAYDCCLCCIWADGHELADICYCIFCCSRHITGHDAGCCDCGEACCSCPDGCWECEDCDCDCGDCDCNGCDCGDCDCNGCDCGDCVIL